MEALKQAWSQLVVLYRRLSPNARLTAALVVVAIVVGLGWMVRGALATDTVLLLGGQTLSSDELTAMQTALAKAQLSDFTVEGNRIRVPRERQAQYIAALAENRALPESVPEMLSAAIDKVNWFTNGQQQADYKEAARLKSLTSILRSFDGVESAEVVFDKSETRSLRPERTMTALVAVKLRGGRPLDDDRAAMFRSVLTAAIAGLLPQHVTVVDKATNRSHHYQADVAAGAGSRYRDSKRDYEAQYEERVRQVLHYIPGVIVSAEVELEHASHRGLSSHASVSTTPGPASTAAPSGSSLGAAIATHGAANQPLGLTVKTVDPSATPAQISVSTIPQAAVPPRELPTSDADAYVPKRVCLSIGVPVAYFENVWRQRSAAPPAQRAAGSPPPELAQIQTEELANIRQLAAPIVQGASAGADGMSLVTVTPVASMVSEPAPPASLFTRGADWLTTPWGPLVVVLTVIAGVWMLKSRFRSTLGSVGQESASNDPSNAASGARARAARIDESTTLKPSSPFHDRLATTNSLRDELADMVREDPDVAANILRTWIGNSNT